MKKNYPHTKIVWVLFYKSWHPINVEKINWIPDNCLVISDEKKLFRYTKKSYKNEQEYFQFDQGNETQTELF